MSLFDETLDLLAGQPCWGYRAEGATAVEPTALAAMALAAGRRREAAERGLQWLAEVQDPPWTDAAEKAIAWILSFRGRSLPRSASLEHDTTLCGWPWVESTHSWVEPTAINLMALKRSGKADHVRSREAVALLLDRMLPSGGWNYGNTKVLGNTLRPHVQPTGLALAALHGEPSAAEHVQQSIDYLDRVLSEKTTSVSLCYALIGLAAHGHRPAAADRWLEAAWRRALGHDASPYKLALLTMARLGSDCPWFADALVGRQR
ncbi:MAG: hypothetical protein ACYSWU_29345 [Planctomycetota bacterium]|jgi:hypothetical protein